MISNHFPSTFGNANSWLVLSALILVGVGVRHWFNLKGKGVINYWLLPVAISLLIAVVIYTMPQTKSVKQETTSEENITVISDHKAMQIIETHCLSCHSATPTSTIFSTAPKGMMFDSYDAIKTNADLIKVQAVNSQIMPLGNTTNMTDTERQELGAWIEQLE